MIIMENLIDQFGSSLQSFEDAEKSQDEFSTSYLYKYREYTGLKQEERRKDLLERQKRERCRSVDRSRGILELIDQTDDSQLYKPLYVPGFARVNEKYNNLLMFSEWLVEKPHDLDTNWYALPCPLGKRVAVVLKRNSSTCYDKVGRYLFSFQSAFSQTRGFKQSLTILDCIWSKCNNTFYILDLLVWNNYPVIDTPTDFRQYWIETKLSEAPELIKNMENFAHKFYLLPKVNCTRDDLNRAMNKFPFFSNNYPAVDGWLFYHKQAFYEAGTTPLVGWLKPYMVNEIFGNDITVHKSYSFNKPGDYTNQENYIKQFNEKSKARESKRKTGDDEKICAQNGSVCVETDAADKSPSVAMESDSLEPSECTRDAIPVDAPENSDQNCEANSDTEKCE